MKRTVKTLLMIFAVAFGVLLMSGTESKAAITSVKQTDMTTTRITLQWSAELGAGHYDILMSNDKVNWVKMDDYSGTEGTVYDLAVDTLYYAKVQAYTGYSWSDDRTLISESPVIAVATAPEIEDVTNFVQSSATTNSITMKWDKMAGAVGYDIWYHDGNTPRKIATTAATSYTVSGLVASTTYDFMVVERKATKTGVAIIGEASTWGYRYTDMKTVPSKVLNTQITALYDSINVAYYGWNSVNGADGYQFQLQKTSGKVLVNTYTSSDSVRLDPYYKGTATKARARAYITLGGKKFFGAWSDANYNALAKNVKLISKNRKITVKWSKISGVKNYTVYISKSENSGWKKVKKLGAKKKKIVIKKCGKKKLKRGTRYYVKIKYGIKSGKKTITSKIVSTGSIYVY